MSPSRLALNSGLIATSLIVHSGLFYSFDRVLTPKVFQQVQRKIALKKKKDNLEIRFVESSPNPARSSPKKTALISDHDSLNQDLTSSRLEGTPKTQWQSPADQRAQHRGTVSQPAKPLSEFKQAMRPTEKSSTHSPEQMPSSESRPQTQILGLPGKDKIITRESGRFKSHGAHLFGMTSFEVTGSGMGEYMKCLKEKIWMSWFPYLSFHYPSDFRGADAVIGFVLDPQGDIKIVRVVESEGSSVFASYCVEAVQKASGFGALPKEILELVGRDGFEIKFGFHYR